ncbi:hypothetical protein [Halomonas aquatica]|uniref:Uncharacterized protein n=1 Tax=Halomonas aquatica TaxID=3151123 RepID=A0ABV1NI68_9GAMM
MGKITRRGLAKPDDPIFSTGPEISSNHAPTVDRDPEAVKAERDLFSRLGKVKQPPMDNFTDSTGKSGSGDSPPRDLVELVARRHGVSRKEAQEMIDESGEY